MATENSNKSKLAKIENVKNVKNQWYNAYPQLYKRL